jgi:hypothetical protein
MNEVQTPGSLNEPQTTDVTPQTRDTLLEQLTFLIDGARSNLMDMKASLAIDGPLLKPDTQYTLGAEAREENMAVRTKGWSGGVEVEVEMEEGGFSFSGDVTIDEDTIKDAVTFEDHDMTDEQVNEILNS